MTLLIEKSNFEIQILARINWHLGI